MPHKYIKKKARTSFLCLKVVVGLVVVRLAGVGLLGVELEHLAHDVRVAADLAVEKKENKWLINIIKSRKQQCVRWKISIHDTSYLNKSQLKTNKQQQKQRK